MKKRLSPLSKRIKHQLIERDMSIGELATEAKLSREYTSSVVNGRVKSPTAMRAICDVLDIIYDDSDSYD